MHRNISCVRTAILKVFGDGILLKNEKFDGGLKNQICLLTFFINNYVKM